MLFFLMKMDGRVRLQLFLLALIAGSEIIPAVQGLECYDCSDLEDFSTKCDASALNTEKECGSCYYDLDYEGKGGVAQRGGSGCRRGPITFNEGDIGYTCAREVNPNGCILQSGTELEKHVNCLISEKQLKQVAASTPDPNERRGNNDYFKRKSQLKRCYCNTELCNMGPRGKKTGDWDGGDGGEEVASTEPGPKNSGVRIAPSKGYPLRLVLLVSLFGLDVTRRNYNP